MSSIKQDKVLYKITVFHYGTSALCFLCLALMMLFSVEAFAGHYFNPKLLAMTHLAALGWGTLIIFGASYQLLPVVLETDLFSKKLAWISYTLFLPGLIALVSSFWVFDPGIYMQSGSILLLTAILLYTVNVFFTARKKKQESIHQDFIVTACLWLTFTALLGALMVFNFSFAFLPKDHLHFLKLHAHMGIAGWFLLLIIGVSAKLIPMFLVSACQNARPLSWAYYLINGALLLFLVDTYISGINFKTYPIALTGVAGVVLYLFFVIECFKSRIRKTIDLPMMSTFSSFVMLGVAVTVLPLIIYYHLNNDPVSVNYSVLYGTLLFMGWISAVILGLTFKTLPFIVWVKHYEHLSGKVKTPMPADLVKNKFLKLQAAGFITFWIAFFPGVFISSDMLKYTGIAGLLLTSVMYLVNVAKVLLHKTKASEYDQA